MFDDIEFNCYHVRKPHWIPRKRKHENPFRGQNGGGAGNFKGKEDGHWKKAEFHKGDMVFNDSLNPEMKIPDPGTYHEVFNPEHLKGARYPKHEDGSEKCNNRHHRGHCWAKCDRLESHKKKLTAKEVEEGKKFVLKAFGLWSAKKKNVAVPDGHPPKNNEKKNEEKAEGEE